MMKTVTAKISSRYQMVIPKEVRDILGVKPGDTVLLAIEKDQIRLFHRPKDYTEYTYGLGRDVWKELGGGEKFHLEEQKAWE